MIFQEKVKLKDSSLHRIEGKARKYLEDPYWHVKKPIHVTGFLWPSYRIVLVKKKTKRTDLTIDTTSLVNGIKNLVKKISTK